ncbi:hypothetical protein GCM10007385_28260 [Tateyamaria omphalii]|nr:hypothetical protein GCM10007385_28260 [Tateyamaria omphalii]
MIDTIVFELKNAGLYLFEALLRDVLRDAKHSANCSPADAATAQLVYLALQARSGFVDKR